MTSTDFRLTDRLVMTDGVITLSGAHALMRVPIDQQRADNARGLKTATLISGYRGSPLGGIEGIIAQHKAELDAAEVRFISGVNEDLAATAIWGSQMTVLERNSAFDGIKGIWYGKGPGVDRSGDAFRHANVAGVDRYGGVLALAGDDPECKSSTIPSASEFSLADVGMPVLYPADVADVLRLGRYGFELSRASGLWVGVKVHTDVADGFATIPADSGSVEVVEYLHEVNGEQWRATVENALLAPASLQLEEEVFGERIEAAMGFMRANSVDRSWGATDAWLGIVVAGKPIGDVREALATLGIDQAQLADFGIRIFGPGLISPLEPQGLRAFAEGLETILVVEAKRPFIETQVRNVLYGSAQPPIVVGKLNIDGERLVPLGGALSSDVLVEPLRTVLLQQIDPSRLAKVRERIPLVGEAAGLATRRPFYCSGCPHNRSTVVPDGSTALGGIGCHAMVLWMDRSTEGLTQMGGEGAQWVGTAPFVGDEHRFQNLGDGTFFHSGSLAIRQAVAAGTNLTYKILYNGVVAMTGGQDAAGEMPVPELTRWLEAEGVVRTVVVTDDVKKYERDIVWAKTSELVDRDELDAVQRQLRDIPGVTALVYDQGCAADLRRNRKRGEVITPTTRVMINEAICDGCGDCGDVSNCMSVHPIDTPFGRKTQIHQESCNFDLTCVDGNCPAFVTVEIDPKDSVEKKVAGESYLVNDVPAEPQLPAAATLLIVGIGGTGVITVSQVLSTASMLDGLVATSLDQTGLAQKGGSVVSNLHIAANPYEGAAKIGRGGADTLLLFDLVGGTSTAILERADPGASVAFVSTSRVPTDAMITDVSNERFPELDAFRARVDAVTNGAANVWIDAEGIARHLFASQPAANMLLLGVAFQAGRIPVGSGAIERAIELNGVAVETNRAAFRLGRRLGADPSLASEIGASAAVETSTPPVATREVQALLDQVPNVDSDLIEVLLWRIPELIEWGNIAYARSFVADVAQVRRAELAHGIDGTALSTTAARQLFKLMAYKDEYEVARLALREDPGARARARFGANAKVSFRLKPPALKRVGVDRKIAIPEAAARKLFISLLKTKRLRGTRFDPFGRTEERRIERALIVEYRELLKTVAADVSAERVDDAFELLGLADQVRGFDDVKLANVARYREQLAPLLDAWSVTRA